jgi:prolyl-tRNA editing enzyme YbaK/EbsC (Cys-tRNA(Pro) deacylase)
MKNSLIHVNNINAAEVVFKDATPLKILQIAMLEDFIQTNGINAQILTFDEEVATSRQAREMEQNLPIVKTILLAHEKGFVLAILHSRDKISFSKIEAILSTKNIRLATPAEVEEVTGYVVGGVPPISIYGSPTLIDEKVLTHAWVMAGGGTPFALLKINTKDILAHAYEPVVEKITA